jgi:hypothetical protein
MLTKLDRIKPSSDVKGDSEGHPILLFWRQGLNLLLKMSSVLSAMIVAVDKIRLTLGEKKWRREIILVTDGESETDWEGSESVKEQMDKNNIELAVAGVDFDDPKLGFKEEEKNPVKVGAFCLLIIVGRNSQMMFLGEKRNHAQASSRQPRYRCRYRKCCSRLRG